MTSDQREQVDQAAAKAATVTLPRAELLALMEDLQEVIGVAITAANEAQEMMDDLRRILQQAT